jgi:hypothetical protein
VLIVRILCIVTAVYIIFFICNWGLNLETGSDCALVGRAPLLVDRKPQVTKNRANLAPPASSGGN